MTTKWSCRPLLWLHQIDFKNTNNDASVQITLANPCIQTGSLKLCVIRSTAGRARSRAVWALLATCLFISHLRPAIALSLNSLVAVCIDANCACASALVNLS